MRRFIPNDPHVRELITVWGEGADEGTASAIMTSGELCDLAETLGLFPEIYRDRPNVRAQQVAFGMRILRKLHGVCATTTGPDPVTFKVRMEQVGTHREFTVWKPPELNPAAR